MLSKFKKWFLRSFIGAVLFNKNITRGQIYILRGGSNKGNPFSDDKNHTVEIIDVKDGFVNYKFVGSTIFINESMKTSVFNGVYRLTDD